MQDLVDQLKGRSFLRKDMTWRVVALIVPHVCRVVRTRMHVRSSKVGKYQIYVGAENIPTRITAFHVFFHRPQGGFRSGNTATIH